MDELSFLALAVGVSVGVGYVAASVKAGREMRAYQRAVTRATMTSTTQFLKASMDTLVEDFKIPEPEAMKALFAQAEKNGMKLMQIDPASGSATPMFGEKQ